MDATPGLEPKGMVCCGHQRSKGQKVSGQELRTEVSKWDTVSSSQPNYFPLRKVQRISYSGFNKQVLKIKFLIYIISKSHLELTAR